METRFPGVVFQHRLAIPRPQFKNRPPAFDFFFIGLWLEKTKEELTKVIMHLVIWHSDTQPLLGVLGGEVTLTSQKHKNEKDETQPSLPKEQKQILHLFQSFLPAFDLPKEIFFHLEFLFNFSLLLFFIQEDELVSISLITNFQNLECSDYQSFYFRPTKHNGLYLCSSSEPYM